jgi:hypothetical protein
MVSTVCVSLADQVFIFVTLECGTVVQVAASPVAVIAGGASAGAGAAAGATVVIAGDAGLLVLVLFGAT